ncbi:MAG: pyridoxal-phosphate dependent enzyme [Brevirhabdus sp.]
MELLTNPYRGAGLEIDSLAAVPMPSTDAAAPVEMLARCPRAGITPLASSDTLAARAGVAEVLIKDERPRMGLGSFKALGAAYVIACDAAEGRAKGATYITASAGNHGLSVAAGAAAFGAHAVIYLAETVPESFAQRLRDHGAEVRREGAEYEASMDAASRAAEDEHAILLSDSSWEGYVLRPHRLMEGYLALMAEVFGQIEQPPTHVFLQAGVGGLAGAMAALARAEWGDTPVITVVEPEVAPALAASINAGKPVHAAGPVSSMGRLDCKEPSLIALKGLARDADYFVTISEDEGFAGIAAASEAGFETSPSGGAGLSALLAAAPGMLGLDETSRVLVILSEGPA